MTREGGTIPGGLHTEERRRRAQCEVEPAAPRTSLQLLESLEYNGDGLLLAVAQDGHVHGSTAAVSWTIRLARTRSTSPGQQDAVSGYRGGDRFALRMACSSESRDSFPSLVILRPWQRRAVWRRNVLHGRLPLRRLREQAYELVKLLRHGTFDRLRR
jgi:hypothetical protein